MDPIYLMMRTSYQPLIDRYHKTAAFLNQVLCDSNPNQLYLEVVKDGVLYIFRDRQTFQRLITPPSPLPKSDPLFEDNSLINQLMIDQFPAGGIHMTIEIDGGEFTEIYSSVHKYLQEIHCDFKIKPTNTPNSRSFKVEIKSIEAYFAYIKSILIQFRSAFLPFLQTRELNL